MANKWTPVPLPSGAYSDDARSWTAQDLLGWLSVTAEQGGGRSGLIARQAPGLQDFAFVPGATRQRGARNVEGRLYFVAETSLCQLLPSGSVTILGTIPGHGRVSMSHNQITNGNQLVIMTGTAGYILDTTTSVLTQITDEGFLGGLLARFLGARFLTLDPARRLFQWSDLAAGAEWSSLNDATGESSPDRIRGMEVVNNELVLLNERTFEHFAYTGATNNTFANKGISRDYGCASSHATSVLESAIFCISDRGVGLEIRDYEARRITTHAIEQAWAQCDLSKAFSFIWADRGHAVWYVTFPDGYTWGYDVATRAWHRRSSYNMSRWRLAWCEQWNGAWYGGEYNSGRVFRLDWAYPREGSDPLPRACSPGVLHRNGNRGTLHALRVQCEAGPTVAASPVFPLAFDMDQYTVDGVTYGGDLPDMAVGDVVDFWYRTRGGMGAVTLTLDGDLPLGLIFDNGHITGTATTAEHDNAWAVQAEDSVGTTATLDDTCYVLDLVGTPPDAIASAAYSFQLEGVEGEAPYAFALTTGTPPPGITLSSAGLLSGTAGASLASYPITVTMTDSLGADTVKAYSIAVVAAPPLGVFVTNNFASGNSYYVIDPTLDTVSGYGPALGILNYPTVNAGQTRLYVGHLGATYCGYVTIATGAATYFASNKGQMVVDSSETYAYVGTLNSKALRRVTVATGVEDVSTTTKDIADLCISDDDAKVYLASLESGFVFASYDTATQVITNATTTGYTGARGIALNVAQTHCYVTATNTSSRPYLIKTPVGSWSDAIKYDLNALGVGGQVAVSPDGSQVAVASFDHAKVWIFDSGLTTLLYTLTTAGVAALKDVIYSMDGTKLYTTTTSGGFGCYVFETTGYTLLEANALAGSPYGIAVT